MTTEPKFAVGDHVYVLAADTLLSSQKPFVGRVFNILRVIVDIPPQVMYRLNVPIGANSSFLESELQAAPSEELIDDYRAEVQGR